MGKKVAELNTLSDGKGITGIRFFNEMEDTNESTNLRKLADVWMSKNRCCQGHRNRSAVSVTRITVDIGRPSQEEEEVNPHRFRRRKNMNPKNTKKSPIHENADANTTCDFGDGDISRLGVVHLTHEIHRPTYR